MMIKLDTEEVEEIIYSGDCEFEEETDRGRWSYWIRYIFKKDDKFWEVEVEYPATEYQEIDKPEYYECYEVEPVETKIIDYKRKK